jgi:hypothetical protein
MNVRISVIKKGSSTKAVESICPWIMDIPPEAPRQS